MVLGGVLVALAAVAAWIVRPRPPELFPLAELVPADAVFYAGFRDYREIEAIRTPWSEEIRKRLDPARPHLAGPIAIYLDRSCQWVALARLTRASALIAGAEIENGAAVTAETPEAMARRKSREGSLDRLPEFVALESRIFLNLELLKLRGRPRDFSAVGLELKSTEPFVVRGRALYRRGLFRTYLERYVHAPRRGSPEGSAPVQASLTEHFPRVWEEILHDVLSPLDCEKAEREAMALSRDVLDGRPFREFLGRLGPGCGVALVPTPHARPALVAWIELQDKSTRDQAQAALHHAIQDGIRVRRDKIRPLLKEILEPLRQQHARIEARLLRRVDPPRLDSIDALRVAGHGLRALGPGPRGQILLRDGLAAPDRSEQVGRTAALQIR